jgi:cell division cycle 14
MCAYQVIVRGMTPE